MEDECITDSLDVFFYILVFLLKEAVKVEIVINYDLKSGVRFIFLAAIRWHSLSRELFYAFYLK